MDFRSLLQSMTSLSEAETKDTKTGRVHKGDYGTSYDGDDEKKPAASTEKRGRGRPKKGADDSGEVKSYDTKSLGSVFGGGQKPKKEVGKVSKKHSLKEYMEASEQQQKFEAIMEGMFGGVDHASVASNLSKLARVIKSVQTPEQFAVAQKYAKRMQGSIMNHQHDKMGFGSGLRANMGVMRDVEADLKAKAAELGIQYSAIEEDMTSQAPVQIKPASQTNTQVIQQGNKTLGTVNNPQLAAQIKQSIGKGEMSLNPNEQQMNEGKDEGKPGKNFAKIAKSAGKEYGSKAAGARVAGAVRNKLKAQGKLEESDKADKDYDGDGKIESGKDEHKGAVTKAINKALGKDVKKKVDESISLAENPATLQHIISKYKNEVKRFINGDEMDNDLFEALYDYYMDCGEIPYGVAKGRTGDPYEWVDERFARDVHDHVVDEGILGTLGGAAAGMALGGPIGAAVGAIGGQEMSKGGSSVFDESDSIRDNTQHGSGSSDFAKKASLPVQNPTPWKVDPINAATDRAINFISGLGKKENKFESKDMKDIQVESWEKQLNGLLTEGITVSSSTGQQGAPDSVSITANEADAQQLMQVLRSAGIGGFGGGEQAQQPGYGIAQGGEGEPTGTGTEPEVAPDVVGDGDDMLSLMKKMAGIQDGPASAEQGSEDYKDEEGSEEQGALEPTDGDEEEGSEESDSEGSEEQEDDGEEESVDEEQTDEGNAFTGKLKQTPQGGNFKMGDKSYKDTSEIEEGDIGKAIGSAAGAALGAEAGPMGMAAGSQIGGAVGDKLGDMVEEEDCYECGHAMESCECEHEQVEENFANSTQDPAETELMKLKALLSVGNDLHKMKTSQAMGNPLRVAEATQAISDWKKLSGIK